MSEKKQGIYEFHNFQLDVGKGLLLRDEQPITLQWKTFELLCTLVKSKGNLITRDELMNELWAETFVEDNNLSQHIRALRKALGENGNEVKFIETVAGRGYRFLPKVRTVDPAKVYSQDETLGLTETENISNNFTLEQLEILYPTSVPQPFNNENDEAIVPIVAPQTSPKSSSWLKPFAFLFIAIAFIAGIIAWNKRDNSSHRRLLYANQINLASQAWETSNLPLLKEQLDTSIPKNGEEDLRAFEWYYLSRLYADSISAQSLTLEHNGWLGGVAFSPDGKTLATANSDNKARIWDATTGEMLATFKGHTDRVESVAFSPDGNTLATGSYDATAKLWDLATGQLLFTMKGHTEKAGVGVYFSPDGRVLATANNKETKFWNVANGKEIKSFQDRTSPIAFSPDGKVLGTISGYISVKLWDIVNGRNITTFDAHSDLLTDIKFSPDGKMLATSSFDKTAKIWEAKTCRLLHTLTGHTSRIFDIAFSPDGKLLATGGTGDDRTIRLWNVVTGQEFAVFRGHEGEILALAFSPDSRKLASGSGDKTVRIWGVPQNDADDLLKGHTEEINAIAFSPDSKTLATVSNDATAKLWDVATGQNIRTLKGHAGSINVAAFSPDGKILATSGEDNLIKLWDAATGNERSFVKSINDISNLTFSPDSKTLATSNWDSSPIVELWDVTNGQQIGALKGHTAGIRTVAFSPDGKQMLTASEDHTVRLWDVATRQEISTLKRNPETDYIADFSTDGQMLVVEGTNQDRTIKLFNASTEAELATFKGNTDGIISFSFSPDRKRFITGSWDGNVRLWDVSTGQQLLGLKGSGVAFAPDGKTVAIINTEKTVRLLRTSTDKE